MEKFKNWIIAHKLVSIIIASVLVVGITLAIVLPLTLVHKHAFSESWSVDEAHHWHACVSEECEETKDYAEHTFVAKNDETKRWQECSVCGYKKDETSHIFVTKYDETKHWQECSVCGYKKDEANHDFNAENKCQVCQKIKSTLTIAVADYTYGEEVETFQASWITDCSGGCESDTGLYSYEYFKLDEDEENWISLGGTLPKNAGKYKVVVTYDGDEEEGYLPTTASSEFTIQKRQLGKFNVFVDDSLIPTEVDETLQLPVINVTLNADNVAYETSVADSAKILAGDELNAKIVFYGIKSSSSIKNRDYRLSTKIRPNVQIQIITLDSENYCFAENSLSVGMLYIVKKLTNGEETQINVENNTNNDNFYYSYTFSLEAGKKARFTLTRTKVESVGYSTVSFFAPSKLAEQLKIDYSGLTKTVELDNSTGTDEISTTIYICVDPGKGVTEIDNTIQLDYEVVA